MLYLLHLLTVNLQQAQHQPEPKQQRFVRLYEPLHDNLCRFVQTLVWNKEDAKDVVSETALRAYEGLEQLRSEDAFLSYLFSIASNLVKQKIRKKSFGVFLTNIQLQIYLQTLIQTANCCFMS